MDLKQHLLRQMAFSHATFGPGKRKKGVITHIQEELDEVFCCDENKAAEEWVDVVLLALDGLTREVCFTVDETTRNDPNEVAEQVCNLINRKQSKNEGRQWPNWRLRGQHEPIGHIE